MDCPSEQLKQWHTEEKGICIWHLLFHCYMTYWQAQMMSIQLGSFYSSTLKVPFLDKTISVFHRYRFKGTQDNVSPKHFRSIQRLVKAPLTTVFFCFFFFCSINHGKVHTSTYMYTHARIVPSIRTRCSEMTALTCLSSNAVSTWKASHHLIPCSQNIPKGWCTIKHCVIGILPRKSSL